ncbi:MAG: FtsX-like permease family protein [Clostridiales bacterium]|nr:FtsX-like permease family protein [Clostridiales bacterium]
MLIKSTIREMRSTIERWLAILLIVALGVGFFCGLKLCKPDMLATGERYLTSTNFYDYKILSSYGIDDESVALAKESAGVTDAEASIEQDILVDTPNENFNVCRVYSVPERINTIELVSGRMPSASDECVVDGKAELKVGDYITLGGDNESADLDKFNVKKFKVVGVGNTPIYLDFNRDNSTIGNGRTDAFMYVSKAAFTTDYYTSLYLKMGDTTSFFGDNADEDLAAKEKGAESVAAQVNEARREASIVEGQKQLDAAISEYEAGLSEYNIEKRDVYAQLADGQSTINSAQTQITSGLDKIAAGEKELAATSSELSIKEEALNTQLANVQVQINQINDLINITIDEQQLAQLRGQLAQLNAIETNIKAGILQVKSGKDEVANKSAELARKKSELEGGKAELDNKRRELDTSKSKADREFASAQAELEAAKSKIDEAQKELDNMEAGKSYTMSRNENAGFSTFEQNCTIVDNIAKIFPVFFFLIAALVCMTTMTRMIDEQRTQVGILRALGYSNSKIVSKYLFYSGSASFLGAVIGYFAGIWIFPTVIWHAYQMMYTFSPRIKYVVDWKLAGIALAIAILGTIATTLLCSRSELKEVPAQLIRPKSPPAGKRILLERVDFIWKKISFIYKVAIRNTFRYKKRFFMMVLGISGCTALLVAANGLSTSIKDTAKYQYNEIQVYDYMAVFDQDMTSDKQTAFADYMDGRIDDVLFVSQTNADVKTSKGLYSVSLVATAVDNKEDAKKFKSFVDLHDGGEDVEYPGLGEAVICKKISDEYNLNVGDKVTIKAGYDQMTLKVSGICDNFIGDYVYVSDATYEDSIGSAPKIKTAYIKDNAKTIDLLRENATYASNYDEVVASVVNEDLVEKVDGMMVSLNLIVYAVTAAAALLAFIVLYNLTNINIIERIREIATIKVLGFTGREVTAYVFRENFILTAIAAAVGLPMGYELLNFAVTNIVVNGVFFESRLTFGDYAVAYLLTIIFAAIVALVMQRKLRNVNMTESLKAIE